MSRVSKHPTIARLFLFLSSFSLAHLLPNRISPPRQLVAEFIPRCCDGEAEVRLGFHVAVGLLTSFLDRKTCFAWPTESPVLPSTPRTRYYNALDLFKPPASTPSRGLRA
ncbi:hypothetical protein C8J56DRAFT_938541 [Mycena floridula]|nr:hypothetical protein C8J56DRAFT_938541 [Mycena floridula]